MCGRYTYLYKWRQLHRLMRLLEWPQEELFPRFNVAPTQRAPVVRLNEQGQRQGMMLKWGLVPAWVKDPAAEPCLNNARGETVFTKPSFREAVKKRRCLVPVTGFYEWQAVPGEKSKQPYWIGRTDREPFCFAGLWEAWRDGATPNSPPLETFSIITTSPNPLMAPLHDRMPVIITSDKWEAWLDPATSAAAVAGFIHPYSGNELTAYPVSRAVNKTDRDDAGLMERVTPLRSLPGLFG